MEVRLGGRKFAERTGATNVDVRLMEAAGVIAPTKTESGWRQFSEADIEPARSWLAEHKRRRKRA